MIDTLAHLRDAQTCLLAAWAKVERATERLTDARSAELTRAQRCSRLAVILAGQRRIDGRGLAGLRCGARR